MSYLFQGLTAARKECSTSKIRAY